MFGWKRPYRDWRVMLLYPAAVAVPAGAVLATLSSGHVWLMTLAAVTVTALLWRVAREGIYVSTEGVRVQRLLSSRVLRWSEIHRIRDAKPFVIAFQTTSGETVLSAVQRSDTATDRFAPVLSQPAYASLVKRLRQLHEAAAKQSVR